MLFWSIVQYINLGSVKHFLSGPELPSQAVAPQTILEGKAKTTNCEASALSWREAPCRMMQIYSGQWIQIYVI